MQEEIMQEEITTKAAKCPKCGKYHLIASIDDLDKSSLRDFAKFMRNGFEIINVSTQNAKDNFGYC